MFKEETGSKRNKNDATEEKADVEQGDERPQSGGERKTKEERFAEMDANKDGKIAKSETTGRMAENFATIDANSDGFITLEEMKKVRPAGGRPGGRPGGGK